MSCERQGPASASHMAEAGNPSCFGPQLIATTPASHIESDTQQCFWQIHDSGKCVAGPKTAKNTALVLLQSPASKNNAMRQSFKSSPTCPNVRRVLAWLSTTPSRGAVDRIFCLTSSPASPTLWSHGGCRTARSWLHRAHPSISRGRSMHQRSRPRRRKSEGGLYDKKLPPASDS